MLNRPEPQIVLGDDDELERIERQEAELEHHLEMFGLVKNTARPSTVVKCPICRRETTFDQAREVPTSS